MIVLGVDPGATTGWCVYDAVARRVVTSGQFPEHKCDILGCDGPEFDVVVIERPKGQGPTRPQVVECGITFGRLAAMFEAAAHCPVEELLRYEVKSILSAATHGEIHVKNDSTAWASLVLLHGDGSGSKARTRKGEIVELAGRIGGVTSHERAALAVAVAWSIREQIEC